MRFYSEEKRSATYSLVLAALAFIIFLFCRSLSLLSLCGLFAALFLLSDPFAKISHKRLCLVVLLVLNVILGYAACVCLSKTLGYADLCPNVSAFPLGGVLLLGSFYTLLTARDDADEHKSAYNTLFYRKTKTAFLLTVVAVLCVVLSYTTAYQFDPAGALTVVLLSLFETGMQFKPDNADKKEE